MIVLSSVSISIEHRFEVLFSPYVYLQKSSNTCDVTDNLFFFFFRYIALKTLGGMQWVSDNFGDDVFYTSSDDDIIIDMLGLVNLIYWYQEKARRQKWPEFPIICTYKAKVGDWPERKVKSKWHVPYSEYKWPYWPDYCLGGAYTTSIRVVRQLREASKMFEPIRMDDVFITGILREKIGMPRQFIKQLNVSVANHYFGFRGIVDNSRRNYLKDEWDKLKETLKHSTSCQCG